MCLKAAFLLGEDLTEGESGDGVRISTQVYVLVEGKRKRMEFTGPDGVVREMQVDIDLDVCAECGALVESAPRHAAWHAGRTS